LNRIEEHGATGDYLWDGSGKPDPDVVALERALAPLRHAASPPSFAQVRRRSARPVWLAAAAVVALGVGGAAWSGLLGFDAPRLEASRLGLPWAASSRAAQTAPSPDTPWCCHGVQGTARLEGQPLAAPRLLGVGEALETEAGSRVALRVADIGKVVLEPLTRLRLAETGAQHRLVLERGTIAAKVDAPPRLFVVDTPAGRAVDLGCAYTLSVDARGGAELRVESGWVALEHAGRSAYVPAGARCATDPTEGPGLPRFEDAPPGVVVAVERLGARADADAVRREAKGLCASARPRDTLSLWHLLDRTADEGARRLLHGCIARLAGASAAPARDAVVRGERDALDRERERLWPLWGEASSAGSPKEASAGEPAPGASGKIVDW
jgi:hypothetical protein